MPAADRAASVAESPSVPHGQGLLFEGAGGTFELAVENVIWTGVPVGTGVTGFGVNTQLDFSGAPTQASVYVPPEA
jgi:hypothetical protein